MRFEGDGRLINRRKSILHRVEDNEEQQTTQFDLFFLRHPLMVLYQQNHPEIAFDRLHDSSRLLYHFKGIGIDVCMDPITTSPNYSIATTGQKIWSWITNQLPLELHSPWLSN